MRPDYPSAPEKSPSEPGCIINITQVINSNEVLVDGNCYNSCIKNNDSTYSCDDFVSSDFGHFTMNTKNIADGDSLHCSSIKRIGTYKYTNTLGATKTIPDYKVINRNSSDDNKKALNKYNENFPEKDRKDYQSIFYFNKDLQLLNILSPVVYTPLSVLFSPICLLQENCYITLNNLSDKTISTPYKDRK